MFPRPILTSGLVLLLAAITAGDTRDPFVAGPAESAQITRSKATPRAPASPQGQSVPSRLPFHFTVPLDARVPAASDGAPRFPEARARYEFLEFDAFGKSAVVHGYADSVGSEPFRAGPRDTDETVWLEVTGGEPVRTIFVLSPDDIRPDEQSGGAIVALLRAGVPAAADSGQPRAIRNPG